MIRSIRSMSRNSLGRQVMSLLGASLLITLAVFVASVFYFVNRTESEAWRGRQGEAARNAAGIVAGFILRVRDTMTVVSIVEPDQLVNDPTELEHLLARYSALQELVRTDATGRIIASAYTDQQVLANPLTIPQSQWFLQAGAGQPYLGDVQLSVKNEPYLIMAMATPQGGVVAARVRMDVLWEVVQDIHFGNSGYAYVITRDGKIVAHTDPNVVTAGTKIQGGPELAALLAAPKNVWSGAYTNFEGEQVVGTTAPIPGTDWVIITELPLGEAFATSRMAVFVLGTEALLLIALVSRMMARFVRLQIAKPMEQLRDGADRIAQGDLDHHLGLIRKDEIGQLAAAFDTMANRLQEREQQMSTQTEALLISEARYRAIVEDQTELICRFLPDGTLTFVNEAYCRYFEKQREDLIGHSFIPLIPDEDQPQVEAEFASLSPDNPVVTYEHRVITPDGSLRWQQWTDRALFNAKGQVMEYESVGQDITERRLAQAALQVSEANLRHLNAELEDRVRERTTNLVAEIAERQRVESALRESEERYAFAVRGANDGLWDWNLKSNEIYYSPRWKSMLGFKEEEIGSSPDEWFKRIHPDDQTHVQRDLVSHLKGYTDHFESEYRIQYADGSNMWVLSRGLAVRDSEGTAYRMAGSQTDITARKLVEESLAYGTLHDPLTGLPNRVLFIDRLGLRLEHTKRSPEHLFAVLFLDLDRFKVINDSLGHAVGDQLLIATAQRLQQCVRPEDTVSRLGGDEFAILLNQIGDVSDALRVAERIEGRFLSSFILDTVERSTTTSIGITLSNINYTKPEDLLRDADTAMYRAKALGGNRHQLFDAAMYASAVALLQMEEELKRAVERQEWLVEYQPIISLTSGETSGVEALVRWMHPKRGVVSPLEFIHVAEDTGLILPLGEFVLRTSCLQVKAWRNAGFSKLWVSVNISARQFQDQNLVQKIEQILAETDLPSDGLRLEVTESVAMRDTAYSIKVLNDLAKLGVHVSLDDFGNGYSSLSYLKQFPLKVLKIDQSFIQDIQVNQNTRTITTAIVAMARSLNLEVVAEGVEREEQLDFLRSLLCDNVQGFLLSHPVPGKVLTGLLQKKFLTIPKT